MKDVRVSSINVKGGKKVLARIQRNTDLLTGIIEICKQSNMVTAEINTCIGRCYACRTKNIFDCPERCKN